MSEKLRPPTARLLATSEALNHLTDEAAALVQETEKFLIEECSIGIETYFPYWEQQEEEFGCGKAAYLAFTRIQGKFRLIVSEVCTIQGEPQSAEETVWASCPRQKKLESIAVLPDLLNKIADLADQQVKRTAKMLGTVRDHLAAMKAKGDQR
jgi:hypothetical protein